MIRTAKQNMSSSEQDGLQTSKMERVDYYFLLLWLPFN